MKKVILDVYDDIVGLHDVTKDKYYVALDTIGIPVLLTKEFLGAYKWLLMGTKDDLRIGNSYSYNSTNLQNTIRNLITLNKH